VSMTGALVDVRELSSIDALRDAEALLAAIWQTAEDRPPMSSDVLRAMSAAGCYVAGAYDDSGALIGASAGFLGTSDGHVHLHSHITGVAPSAQGRHVGLRLKEHQRTWCLERGIDVVTWTFDPLVRRNGWFNLHRLGADVVAFHRDFYGAMQDGLNVGDHSDRCWVQWSLPTAEPRPALVPAEDDVVVAVPTDIEALRRDDPAAARAARTSLRDALAAGDRRIAGMTAAGEYVLRRISG